MLLEYVLIIRHLQLMLIVINFYQDVLLMVKDVYHLNYVHYLMVLKVNVNYLLQQINHAKVHHQQHLQHVKQHYVQMHLIHMIQMIYVINLKQDVLLMVMDV